MPIGKEPEVPTYEGSAIVDGTNPAFLAMSADEQNPRLRKTGDFKIERFKRLVTEWVPEDKGALKFRDLVIEELERLVNDEPDYDTGFFSIEAGLNWYTIEHDLGRIPTRYAIYADTQGTDEPVVSKSGVYALSSNIESFWDGASLDSRGLFLVHNIAGTKSFIFTASDYIYASNTSAYIRVLLWR